MTRVGAERLWVYRRPLRHDPLAWVAVVGAVIGIVVALVHVDSARDLVPAGVEVLWGVVGSFFFVGITFGSIREYREARRGR